MWLGLARAAAAQPVAAARAFACRPPSPEAAPVTAKVAPTPARTAREMQRLEEACDRAERLATRGRLGRGMFRKRYL